MWNAYEAYTVGNRKDVGFNRFELQQEPMNDGAYRDYIAAFGNDGNLFIFRPEHPQYEEILRMAEDVRGI